MNDREYCLRNPRDVVRAFGVGVFLSAIASQSKSLLERAVDHHQLHGYALPGDVGRAYRLASLLELRAAQIYGKLARRFADQPDVAAFFKELQAEEWEHGRLMTLCQLTVVLHSRFEYLPRIRDPKIREILAHLRELSGRVATLSLEEALETTQALEQSEINTIFDRLLKQVNTDAVRVFEGRLREVEGHAEAVPKRIAALRQRLASK